MPEERQMSTRTMERFTLQTRDGPVELTGTLLGQGSSQDAVHSHATKFAPKGAKCRACRWYEVQIYRLDDGDLLAHTAGRSAVDGEFTKTRLLRSSDARALIAQLVVQRRDRGRIIDVFMPLPAQDALDAASDHDDEISAALDTWLSDAANRELTDWEVE